MAGSVCFPRRIVIKAEIIRAVAGLGVLEHHAVAVVGLAAPFVLTVAVGKKRLRTENVNETVGLAEIAAGTGANAAVAVLMPESRHACRLKLENGIEVLLHIGIDIVGMNGDGFEYLVQEGQKVRAGTLLIRFDRAKIKAAGHSDVAVCIITDEGNAQDIQFHTGMYVREKETTVADLEDLIRQSRERGMGIMLDMVFNHTSTEHEWFQKALAGDEDYQEYYIFREGTPDRAPTNWKSKFGGSAWEYVPALKKWYLRLYDVT